MKPRIGTCTRVFYSSTPFNDENRMHGIDNRQSNIAHVNSNDTTTTTTTTTTNNNNSINKQARFQVKKNLNLSLKKNQSICKESITDLTLAKNLLHKIDTVKQWMKNGCFKHKACQTRTIFIFNCYYKCEYYL